MLLISVLPFIALCICLEGTSATTPDVNVTVARLSTDIVKVNIQIDIGVQDTPNLGVPVMPLSARLATYNNRRERRQ
jgi:hypothetical protein